MGEKNHNRIRYLVVHYQDRNSNSFPSFLSSSHLSLSPSLPHFLHASPSLPFHFLPLSFSLPLLILYFSLSTFCPLLPLLFLYLYHSTSYPSLSPSLPSLFLSLSLAQHPNAPSTVHTRVRANANVHNTTNERACYISFNMP